MLKDNQLVKGFQFLLRDLNNKYYKYELLGRKDKDDLLVIKKVKDGKVSTVPRLLVIISGKDLFES